MFYIDNRVLSVELKKSIFWCTTCRISAMCLCNRFHLSGSCDSLFNAVGNTFLS